jgi:HEAT repeat protein
LRTRVCDAKRRFHGEDGVHCVSLETTIAGRPLFAERSEVRIEATRALAKLNDMRAFEPLLLRLRRDDAPVREAAVQALRSITGLDFGSEAGRWAAWYKSRGPFPEL